MDLNTITEVVRPHSRTELPAWTVGDAWLAGGTWLFSEPQVHLTRLIDLTEHPGGGQSDLEGQFRREFGVGEPTNTVGTKKSPHAGPSLLPRSRCLSMNTVDEIVPEGAGDAKRPGPPRGAARPMTLAMPQATAWSTAVPCGPS